MKERSDTASGCGRIWRVCDEGKCEIGPPLNGRPGGYHFCK